MTFWRNVLPNMLLQGQNAVLVVKKTPQNFYQCRSQCERSDLGNFLFHLVLQNSITIFTLNPYPLSLSEESFGLVYDAVWPSHMGTITGVINCRLWHCMLILCLGGSFVFSPIHTLKCFITSKHQILTVLFS